MMRSDNMAATRKGRKDGTRSSSSRKTTLSPGARSQEEAAALKCPRCDSPNTKFCYYNNYSLKQPRHFCKTCRRYWTKGGALRNVPIGGGCRKNKKIISKSSDVLVSSALNLYPPAVDFQSSPAVGHFSSNGEITNTSSVPIAPVSFPLLGLDFPLFSGLKQGGERAHDINIESFGINHDLQWRIQQQRLAMLFGGGENHHRESNVSSVVRENQTPADFCAVGGSKTDGGPTANPAIIEWFFDKSYSPQVNPITNTGSGCTSNWNNNGIQAWSDMNRKQ